MKKFKLLFFILLLGGIIYSILRQESLSYEIYAILVALFISTIFFPAWAVYLLIIISPINLYLKEKTEGPIFYAKEYLYLAVLAFFFLRLVLSGEDRKYLRNPLTPPILVFSILMLIQAVRNPSLSVGFAGFKFYVQHIPFLFFGLVFFRSRKKLEDLISITFITLIAIVGLELMKFQGQASVLWQSEQEAIKIGHLTNTIAGGSFATSMLCVVLNCLAMGIASALKGARRLAFLALGIVAAIGVFLSHTRGAYLSLVVSVLALLNYSGKKAMKVFLFPMFIIAVFLVYFPTVSQRFFSTYDIGANARLLFYQESSRHLLERGLWLFGSGLFTHDLKGIQNWRVGMPEPIFFDNYFLMMLAEAGILAIILLGIIYFKFLKSSKSIYLELETPLLKGLALGIIVMWPTLFFSMLIGANTWLDVPIGMFFWLFSGVLFNLPGVDKEWNQGQAIGGPAM